MQPQALSRATREGIRKVLGDAALQGERLTEAVAAMGVRAGIEPFRACLSELYGIHRSEPQAYRTFEAIGSHRAALAQCLGRDPGFFIAAADYLHEIEPASAVSLVPSALPATVGAAGSSLDELLRIETHRSERSGRPLTLLALAPDTAPPDTGAAMVPAAAALRDAARAADHTVRLVPAGFAVVLPCTTGAGGMKAAGRIRHAVSKATGMTWSAGVAALPAAPADAAGLARGAREALSVARRGGGGRVVLHGAPPRTRSSGSEPSP